MQRRTLLKLGLGSAAVLAVAGGGLALIGHGLHDGRLTPPAREVARAVARAVLDGCLPAAPAAQSAALDAHLGRLDAALAGMASATRDEVSQLFAVLAAAPGRWLLAGLSTPWAEASPSEVQQALQAMRVSSVALRAQAYQALRDLTNAAYFSDEGSWAMLRYPGPRQL